MSDRRMMPRFDVVGQLAGTFDAAVSMSVRDVGRGGAQVESVVSLPTGSMHRATFSCDGIEADVQVRIRHVKPMTSRGGELRYLLGVEFVSGSPAVSELIERWLRLHDDGAAASGDAN